MSLKAWSNPSEARPVGLVAFVATAAMLFTAFTASYLVRRTQPDFAPIALPQGVWLSSALLLGSSLTMEFARRLIQPWLTATLGLGICFLASQVALARELQGTGIFLGSGPHASFLYVLGAVHFLHLLGGIVALMWASFRPAILGRCALYWHFVTAVWIWVVLLLWVI